MDEDLRRLFEEYTRLLQQSAQEQKVLGVVSDATAASLKQMRSAIAQDTRALDAFGKELDQATKKTANIKAMQQAAGATAQSFKGLSGSLGQSNQSFSQFAGTIKSVTSTLGKLLGAIPLAGEYLDKGARAVGEASAFVLGQVDTVAKVYSELGTVGALTVRGVDGLRKSFDELGLLGLPEFADAVKRNSIGIAALGSTTSRGAVKIGKALGQLTDARGPFVGPLLNLGFTLQEISAYGTDYISTLALSGSQNIKTTEQVTTAMAEYLRQIDEVSRATGKSREQINEENKKQQADVKFRAKMLELEMSGRGDEANRIRELARLATGPAADAIRASVAGVPLTKEAQGAVALFGGEINRQLDAVRNGASAQDAFRNLIEAGAVGVEKFNKSIQFGAAELLGGDGVVAQAMDMQQLFRRAQAEGIDPIELARQERQRLEAAGGATKQLTDAQAAIAESGRGLQRLALDFLPAATTAVEKFASTINFATNALRKILGLEPMVGTGTARGTAGGAFGAAPPATGAAYYDKIKQLESGGRNIGNLKGSSAFGLYQIMPKTYESLVANAAPGSPLRGTTFEQMKGDVNLQQAAMEALTSSNAQRLARSGLSTSDAAKYMAHVLGVGTASRILGSNDMVDLRSLIPNLDKIREGNPTLFGPGIHTAGDLKRKFSEVTGGSGYQFGGVAVGPRGGYMSVLHGTEAVVPLPDGRTIPVSMPGDITSGIREQVSLLSAQLSKMDEMVNAMRAQTAMSQRILQHSTS